MPSASEGFTLDPGSDRKVACAPHHSGGDLPRGSSGGRRAGVGPTLSGQCRIMGGPELDRLTVTSWMPALPDIYKWPHNNSIHSGQLGQYSIYPSARRPFIRATLLQSRRFRRHHRCDSLKQTRRGSPFPSWADFWSSAASFGPTAGRDAGSASSPCLASPRAPGW